jgi:hypothetical protein
MRATVMYGADDVWDRNASASLTIDCKYKWID